METILLQDNLLKLGYSDLNPMQREAVPLLTNPRLVVSAPTASGKTLLALLKIVSYRQESKNKIIYLVPLRALASEKYHEFTKSLAPFEISVAVSTGDLDSSSEQLAAFDVIIATSEKMDSLLRHKPPWIKDVGLVVCDEVHLINDESRGATLEIVLTKLMQRGVQLLALSATVPNAREMAEWIGGDLFKHAYRPTKLTTCLCDRKHLYLHQKKEKLAGREDAAVSELVKKALAVNERKGQALVFSSTRKSTESTASDLREITKSFLSPEEKNKCAELSAKVLHALGTPTPQCKALSTCIADGIAFHHAGLIERQRAIIEEGFKRERCIKTIVCTTTLAMGVDYPASWVIVKDIKRFNGAYAQFIPNLEMQQIVGRAGRPRFDKEGIAVLLCKSSEVDDVAEKYVYGKLEDIYSKLSSEPVLRMHTLSLIASNEANDFKSVYSFFEKTFYAYQYKNTEELFSKIESAVNELKELDFCREKNAMLVATPVGKRVSELYIDPLSAAKLLEFISQTAKKTTSGAAPTAASGAASSDFEYVLALNSVNEARPLVAAKTDELKKLWEELYALEDFDFSSPEAPDVFKSAKLLNAWINEGTEEQIMCDFSIPPGVLHARNRIMEWLAYAMQELAFLENQSTAYKNAKNLRQRIKKGIKAELLAICRVRGIGRVKGRLLYNAGVQNEEDYAKKTKEEIKSILKTTAGKNEEISEEEEGEGR